ncbi:hypothetical protein K503DRAFT_613719 [Rhizopogon vinicolor AM-OR11-026]|uniref:Transmembrane protein n=1 Tax=Rhizopogon vinicolor AM-OR11-026 TaxID=1314800 RepID=A0A1B7NGH6_9AGAM|nr:hypothetical protein K503DRAFT_613719 [Rhizopogon vinicolor AM-OR11-026]
MADMAVRHSSPPEHAQEQLPEVLGPSHLWMICTLALHLEHWTSLQSDEAFEKARRRVQCVLVNTAIAVLTMESLVLLTIVKTSSSYFNSTSAPYLLLTLSSYTGITGAWLAVYSITVLQRIYDRSVLKRGSFFRAIYLLSIFTPLCCTALSLCFCVFAFTSSSSAYCALAMLLLVMNVVVLRTISMRFRKAREKSQMKLI